jgi:rhamnosyl/mannosyltransferase
MIISIITPTASRLGILNNLYLQLIKIKCKKNFEWVVVYEKNDLNTINFLKKIKLESKINITLVKNNITPNRPTTVAKLFNQGVIKARGDIVSFLGDDDRIFNNTIKLVLNSFNKNPQKDWLVGLGLYHKTHNIQVRSLIIFFKNFLLKNFFSLSILSTVNFLMTPSVFVKKNFFIKNGMWNNNNLFSNDYECWLKLTTKQKPIILKKILSSTGICSNTVTSRFNIKKYLILLKLGFKNLRKFSIFKIPLILSILLIFAYHLKNLCLGFFIHNTKSKSMKFNNEKKRKILHITRFFETSEYGGIQKLISLIVEKDSCFEFSIVTTHKYKTFIKYLKVGSKKIKIYYFKETFTLGKNVFSFNFLLNFNKIVKNYDTLHFHYPWPSADLIFLLNNLIFNYKKKIILSFHAEIVGRVILRNLYYIFVRYFFFKKVNIFHFTTFKYKKIAKLNMKNKDAFISSIGLTSGNMRFEKNKIKSSISKLKKKDKIILFVGSDRHYKGINLLASVGNQLKRQKVILITNNKNIKKKYKLLNNRFKVYCKVNDHEKNYLLSISRLLLFPSINKAESLGVILLEALYFGLPVVAFKIDSGSVEVLKNNFNSFLVKLYDMKNFTKKINILYSNNRLHKRLSNNAKNTYKKNYTFSNQNFLDIYNK